MPENDPRPALDIPPPPQTQQPIADVNDDHVFDMNQTPEPIPDVDFGGAGGFDGLDSEDEEFYAAPEAVSRAAAKLARQPAHVVDLKQHLSTVPLEYSYFQQSMMSLWAGPAHWKVKPLRKGNTSITFSSSNILLFILFHYFTFCFSSLVFYLLLFSFLTVFFCF